MNYRPQRVGKLIREELAKIMIRELEFADALPTITDVEVDKKLELARVKLSVLPSEAAEKVLAEMEEATPALQHLLLRKINIKPMPRLRFEIDRGPENAATVEKLLLKP